MQRLRNEDDQLLVDLERKHLAKLTLRTDTGDYGYMVHWVRTAGPGEPPKFYPVSNGKTADEAIDAPDSRRAGIDEPQVLPWEVADWFERVESWGGIHCGCSFNEAQGSLVWLGPRQGRI